MQEWRNFDTLDKCLAMLFMVGAGVAGTAVLWLFAVIAGCM